MTVREQDEQGSTSTYSGHKLRKNTKPNTTLHKITQMMITVGQFTWKKHFML